MSRKEIHDLIKKAERSLDAAEMLLQQGYNDFSISRAYYAMFYAVQALLLTRDIRRSKHSGIIAAFNEYFVRTGELPHRLFLSLRDMFEDRAEGDYGLAEVSQQEARSGITEARRFLSEIKAKVQEWMGDKD